MAARRLAVKVDPESAAHAATMRRFGQDRFAAACDVARLPGPERKRLGDGLAASERRSVCRRLPAETLAGGQRRPRLHGGLLRRDGGRAATVAALPGQRRLRLRGGGDHGFQPAAFGLHGRSLPCLSGFGRSPAPAPRHRVSPPIAAWRWPAARPDGPGRARIVAGGGRHYPGCAGPIAPDAAKSRRRLPRSCRLRRGPAADTGGQRRITEISRP